SLLMMLVLPPTLRKQKRHRRQRKPLTPQPHREDFICSGCGRICGSRIGLYSHARRCSSLTVNPRLTINKMSSHQTDQSQSINPSHTRFLSIYYQQETRAAES
uniref:C2H2-type domain-containing protein n=1 Tax=Salarias fasciatus TaxID=181472 RepID=A0A672IC69_SALFA